MGSEPIIGSVKIVDVAIGIQRESQSSNSELMDRVPYPENGWRKSVRLCVHSVDVNSGEIRSASGVGAPKPSDLPAGA